MDLNLECSFIFFRQVKFYEHVCARLCALVASAPVACFPTLVSCALFEFWVPVEVSYISNVSFRLHAYAHKNYVTTEIHLNGRINRLLCGDFSCLHP